MKRLGLTRPAEQSGELSFGQNAFGGCLSPDTQVSETERPYCHSATIWALPNPAVASAIVPFPRRQLESR